jgi:hypothetical protein
MRIRAFGLRVVLLLSGLLLTRCTGSAWQTANVLTDSCIRRTKLALRDVDFDQNRNMATDFCRWREIAYVDNSKADNLVQGNAQTVAIGICVADGARALLSSAC